MSTEAKATPAFESNARAIVEASNNFHGHELVTVPVEGGVTARFAVLPVGKRLQNLRDELESWRERPDMARGTARLTDERSFVAHVVRSSDIGSALFVDERREAPKLTAVYDYHEPGGWSYSDDGTVVYPVQSLDAHSSVLPRWGEHRATFAPSLSDEWKAWHGIDGKPLAPVDLAEFLEEHLVDVFTGEPGEKTASILDAIAGRLATASQLLALSRNFEINVDSVVKHAQKLSSGEINVVYTETHRDGGGEPIKVPNAFLIAIPVFKKGPAYEILVRLRYRMSGAQLRWSLHLHRSELAFDDALAELCARVADATQVPMFFGAPES